MKKTIYTMMLAAGMLLAINVGSSQAQVSNKIHAGAQVSYGTHGDNGIGVGINGYYTITESIWAGINFNYFLGNPSHVTFWALNFNGQYHFGLDDSSIIP